METYTIKLTDGTIKTYTPKEFRVIEEERWLKVVDVATWGETYIPYTSILYYRKDGANGNT